MSCPRLAFLSLAVVLTRRCVTTNATVLNKSMTRPPIAKVSVVIYSSAEKVPGQIRRSRLAEFQGREA